MSSTEEISDKQGVAEQAPAGEAPDADRLKAQSIQVNLRKIPLFANLTEEEMSKVKANLRFRRFARHETVIQKGSAGDSLLFLLAGKLQVVDVTEDGRIIGLRMLSESDFFGEIAVIQGSVRSASVVAQSEVIVAFLPSEITLHLFYHVPSVAQQVLSRLAAKIQQDTQYRTLLSIHNTSKRIYTFLEMLKEKKNGNLEVVENLPTHQDIASIINTSRETVTRTLLILSKQGIIQKDLRRLIIRKPEELQKLAQGDQP
ncbi:MAG TPA: Crp/Fnr family transcriptional regulator [Gallionellaceae bacterium]|jgi:CRP-like cAMP-binding protein|nr:Crp/Fnr family transcriptional regulator [Gallionellaceae bacterium]